MPGAFVVRKRSTNLVITFLLPLNGNAEFCIVNVPSVAITFEACGDFDSDGVPVHFQRGLLLKPVVLKLDFSKIRIAHLRGNGCFQTMQLRW